MSISKAWDLQQAVYARLVAQLTGQGPGGVDVPVFDHAPSDPPRMHVRIDGFNVVQRQLKANKTLHAFNVHVFDRPTDQTSIARGQKEAKQLQQTIVAALHDWQPSSAISASAIRHSSSDIQADEDGLTQHAISRFETFIG